MTVVTLAEHRKQPDAKDDPVPDFITRENIMAMTDEQLDAMLSAIRVRRMKSYAIYNQTKQEKNALEQGKARERVEKKCEQIIKKLNTIDKQLDDLERFVAELRGLRVQAGLEII